MTYALEPFSDATVLTITQEDPREGTEHDGATDDDKENPVLDALKRTAESLQAAASDQ